MITCPCCGYQIREKRKYKKKLRRMRLPNGFGSITKIEDRHLKNPYFVRVTVGKNDKGKPIIKSLKPKAYFKSYNEAYAALLKYNENPYDLDKDMTAKELFDKWINDPNIERTPDNTYILMNAFAYCSEIHGLRVRDIRARHIKYCIENGKCLLKGGAKKGQISTPTPTIKKRIKTTWNKLLDYAVEYELVDRNYSRTFAIPNKIEKEIEQNKKEHLSFSQKELEKLWSLKGREEIIDLILVQCYTGLRPNELCEMERKNVNLENATLKGGSKTEAGIDRLIPIHSAIFSIIKKYHARSEKLDSPMLFNMIDRYDTSRFKFWKYHNYRREFNRCIEKHQFNNEHRPHDPRKTFVTEAKRFGVDDNVIKIIVGHKITDITESIYTQRDIEWLKSDIEKIKAPI